VRVGAVNAYVEFFSTTQVNVLQPATVPALQTWKSRRPLAPSCLRCKCSRSTTGVVYVAQVGALAGVTSRPAKAGDAVELYGMGVEPTNPPWPDGSTFERDNPAQDLNAFQLTIGGVPCPLLYAGMVEPGLFQINNTVPVGVPRGHQQVAVAMSGTPSRP